MNKKVILVIGVLIAVVVLTILGTAVLRKEKKQIIQGQVEVSEPRIASKLEGRVKGLEHKEGDRVKKGDFLFAITTPEIDAKLVQAEAARAAAEAQNRKADAGTRKQIIKSAYNLMKQAQIGVRFAQKSYTRIETLYDDGVIPEQKRDKVKAELEVAIENEKIARDQYELALEGAQKEDKTTAKALVDRAQGAVQEVESYLADASQYAPYNGEISKIIAQNGELSSTGYPVVTMIDIDKAWVSFNIKETLLPKIKTGDLISVYIPGLDKNIELKIHNISVQAEYATWLSTDARSGFDIKTFGVTAYPTSHTEGLRPGMTVLFDIAN